MKRYSKYILDDFSSSNWPRLVLFLRLVILGTILFTGFINTQQQAVKQQAATTGIQHHEYVFTDRNMYAYDMDDGHKLVKQVSLPTSDGVRGVVGNAAEHMLYKPPA